MKRTLDFLESNRPFKIKNVATWNPLQPHCGPGNTVSDMPSNDPIDEACRQHDIGYGKLLAMGRDPYTVFNKYDEAFMESLSRLRFKSPQAWMYYEYFALKERFGAKFSPRIAKKVLRAKARSIRTKRMVYGRRYRGRKRGRRGRKSRRKSKKSFALRYLMSVAQPQIRTVMRGGFYRWANNEQQIVIPEVTFDLLRYHQDAVSQGNAAVDMIDYTQGSVFNYLCKQKLQITIASDTNIPITVTPYWVTVKRDYFDNSIGNSDLSDSIDAILQIMQFGLQHLYNSTDDASFTKNAASANDRYFGSLITPSGISPFSYMFRNYFKIKAGKPVILEPGANHKGLRFNLVDRKCKRIPELYNAPVGGDHTPVLLSGFTKFMMFKFQAGLVGTSEISGGVENELKVARGGGAVHIESVRTMMYKSIARNYAQRDLLDLRPTINAADEAIVGDVDMQYDQVEA